MLPVSLRKAVALAMLLASMIVIAGCGVGEASVSDAGTIEAETPVPVSTVLPTRADIVATYNATATISSDRDAPVTAKVAGEVVALLVEEGDAVVAGQALARLDGERLRLEMLAARANLERAEKEFERNKDLHARGIVSAAQFDGLRFDLESLRATHQLKKLNYNYSTIRATIDGVVSSRDVKVGQNLGAGEVAFRITDTRELFAYLQIPQSELSKFNAGQDVTVQVAAAPGEEFAAEIIRVSPTIDKRNGTFRATARIANANSELAPGMFGRFSVAYEKHEDALVIPADAVLKEDGGSTVYVVIGSEVQRRLIETGVEHDGRVEILDGLADGEVVVVIGQSALRDGSKVLASAAPTERHTG